MNPTRSTRRIRPRTPWAVLALLGAQTGLLWVLGAQLHRQHNDIAGLREDVQNLSESIDDSMNSDQSDSGSSDDGSLAPARHRRHPHHRGFSLVRYRQDPATPHVEEPGDAGMDQGRKEMEETKKANQKAVADARDIRQKLSISENARIAEEKKKTEAATHDWLKWSLTAIFVVVLALVYRAYKNRE